MMSKTTFGAVLAFLFVAAGSLTAAALYLRRREKELDEYESLLFGDDASYADDLEEEEEMVDLPFVQETEAGEQPEQSGEEPQA